MILLVKYSEKACGMSSESKEDGRGVEFLLPRMALKLWNSSLHELLVCILRVESCFCIVHQVRDFPFDVSINLFLHCEL